MGDTAYTTGNNGNSTSIKDVEEAVKKIKSIPKSDQWFLVSPSGACYKGTCAEITGVLLREHPLLQFPDPRKVGD